MSREFAEAIGAKKFGLMLILLAALAVIATLGSQWEQSTRVGPQDAAVIIPAGLSLPAVPAQADTQFLSASTTAQTTVYSLVDSYDFIQRFESGVVVASPGNVRIADNSQAATAASHTGLINGSHSSMPCITSLCGSGAVFHNMKTVFGNIASHSWYPGLNWLFSTADRAVMMALTALSLAVLLPKSLRRDFLLQLQKGRIGKRDLSYSI